MSARIIVIDDNEYCRALTCEKLAEMGHDVVEMRPGPRLLDDITRLNSAHPVDMIVADLFMPEPDGFEILRFGRRRLDGVPIVGLTGRDHKLLDSMMAYGAVHVVQKPIRSSELRSVVDSVLNNEPLLAFQ